uniref:Mobile element protein n=1 Tax=uncultured Thiotrichaceae bacterium TaxID=298394 RepID=A0A6S6T440_9GAMM|nr:MAG: Mobile element protein [uncultured Thiotrichaceae bacterium]
MSANFQIPLDIPDVEILSIEKGERNSLILTVKSTLDHTHCRHCQRKITTTHGYDRPIRLQHLPIFERKVYIELRPKRYRCPDCDGGPTTTQQLDWYTANSPHTKALDQWLLKVLINSTVSDTSRCCQVSYDAVEGCIDRYVGQSVNWDQVEPFATLGLDEIALRKGHKDFVCVVTALDQSDEVIVLAILPDRCKETVLNFLNSIPEKHKPAIKRVCSDMYEGFMNAAKEALPEAAVIIDRFHVAKHYNKGVDDLRKTTLRALKKTLPESGYSTVKGSMWSFRRHYWDLSGEQQEQLTDLFLHAPALKQAWLLRHQLFLIYEAPYSPGQAGEKFDAWIQTVRESGLDCFDGFIRLFEKYRVDILAYFEGRHTSGFVEGLNNKLKVIKRRCFGLLNPSKLFQRIQIDLQERTGFLKIMENTTSCG